MKTRLLSGYQSPSSPNYPAYCAKIRAIIESNPSFFRRVTACNYRQFCRLNFDHPLFQGSGLKLLKYIDRKEKYAYRRWIQNLFPSDTRVLRMVHANDPIAVNPRSFRHTVRRFNETLLLPTRDGQPNRAFEIAYGMLAGPLGRENDLDPEEALVLKERLETVFQELVPRLPYMEQDAILCFVGKADERCSRRLISLSREEIQTLVVRAAKKILPCLVFLGFIETRRTSSNLPPPLVLALKLPPSTRKSPYRPEEHRPTGRSTSNLPKRNGKRGKT